MDSRVPAHFISRRYTQLFYKLFTGATESGIAVGVGNFGKIPIRHCTEI